MKSSNFFQRKRQAPRIDPATNAINVQIEAIRRKLEDFRQYKQMLLREGMKPDTDDKARESELIVRLLRLEKNLKLVQQNKPGAGKQSAPSDQKSAAFKPQRRPKRYGFDR